jgi:hypothetical protein
MKGVLCFVFSRLLRLARDNLKLRDNVLMLISRHPALTAHAYPLDREALFR